LGSILDSFFIEKSLKKSMNIRSCFFDGSEMIFSRVLVLFSTPWKAKKQRDVGGDAIGRKEKNH